MSSQAQIQQHADQVPETCAGLRLDQALAQMFPQYSRSRLTSWIKAGQVLVDGAKQKPRDAVQGGEQIQLQAQIEPETRVQAEAIALDIVFEDTDLLVINKPAGLVVHPGAGNRDGTLQNALLNHDAALAQVPRAGIVHRIDKDTSGLLVVARNVEAHKKLVDMLAERTIKREYEAVVCGVLTGGGKVDAPIARHPVDRKRMAVRDSGRESVTHYRVAQRYRAHTHVLVQLESGRTHQIRVHFAHIRHPLVGDPVYGRRPLLPKGATPELVATLQSFKRQALHARRLSLVHPASGETMEWEAPQPEDFTNLLAVLKEDTQHVR
ncbi:MAG TPA: 23S rRNA pseudouridine(1911/1915/1917) synthase RluD [Gammaproteobacteria bacterium]|nr:23S rRNA pseudouridine(1911/1915/1917) synthase RluD [Gammaproteobacteria bacterium]